MRIGYVSNGSIYDRSKWSGTISFLAESLARNNEVVPIEIDETISIFIDKLLSKLTLGHVRHSRLAMSLNRFLLTWKLNDVGRDFDIMFAPAASELVACGALPENIPLIYLSDATFHAVNGYYGPAETGYNYCFRDRVESVALHRADAVIEASRWAGDDVVAHYGIDPSKVHVMPFCANLPDEFEQESERLQSKTMRKSDEVRLLLVGVDWKRKGVETAINATRILNKRQAERRYSLTIAGFVQPKDWNEANIHFAGRLDKAKPQELRNLVRLYQESDIFILPTRAECAGIVFSEAAMFGLPTVTYATGGTTSYVDDGVTGFCLEPGSSPEAFADAVRNIVDSGKLSEYSSNARKKYELELNWSHWLDRFDYIACKIIKDYRTKQ